MDLKVISFSLSSINSYIKIYFFKFLCDFACLFMMVKAAATYLTAEKISSFELKIVFYCKSQRLAMHKNSI